MEKSSSISSSKFISSTLDNVCLNSNISLTQMKDALKVIDTASYAIIIPILKIQNKLASKYHMIARELNENKDKHDTENNENTTHSEEDESKSDISNNDDNSKHNSNNENLEKFYDTLKNNLDLFTKLSNSEEYENIIKGFNELLPDNGMFLEKGGGSSSMNNNQNEDNDDEAEINKKVKDNNNSVNPISKPKKKIKKKKKALRRFIGTKRKKKKNKNKNKNKPQPQINNNINIKNKEIVSKRGNTSQNLRNNINKILENKIDKPIYTPPPPPPPHPKIAHSQMTKKQRKEIDMLNMIQKDYPSNSYIQRISKTFLSRRLFKKVIYQHIFNYHENGSIDDKKVKTVGESACYKNCKVTFKFVDDKIKNTDKLDEIMGKELKQEFVKLDEDNNEYIIAGKLGGSLFVLIQNVFKKNLLKDLSVVNATLEFYEFYEELISEFDENEENVRIVFCDEIILKHLREDWKNLNICREYVRKKKNEHAI